MPTAYASETPFEAIRPWRERYRAEMHCQILQDSFHERPGWTKSYMLSLDNDTVGHGAVVLGGPWQGQRVLFECYIAPEAIGSLVALGDALIEASLAVGIRAQSNDRLLTTLLRNRCGPIVTEKLVFKDGPTTRHTAQGLLFRPIAAHERDLVFTHRSEPIGDYGLDLDGQIVATGGILWHYNPPYGDLYMEVDPAFRRRGLGRYLVQELKRICREQGGEPCARCDPANEASAKTLHAAGFIRTAYLQQGPIRPRV